MRSLVAKGASYEDQFDLRAPKLGLGRGLGSDTPASLNPDFLLLARSQARRLAPAACLHAYGL
jgi:hypothetical protein